MYCSNCGTKVDGGNFCPNCGASLNGSSSQNSNYNSGLSDTLGALVTVGIISGITRQLFYRNGCYYYDRFCRRPFPIHMISIPHHRMHHHRGLFHGPKHPFGGGHHGGGKGPGHR